MVAGLRTGGWSLAVVVVLVLGCLMSAASPPPTPPKVVQQFFDPGFVMYEETEETNTTGLMWYDEILGGWKAQYSMSSFAGLSQNVTFLQTNQFYYDTDGVCRGIGQGNFSSFFDWVSQSKYNGVQNINGRLVDEWILPVTNGDLILDVDHSNNSIPVRFQTPSYLLSSTSPSNLTFLWSEELVPGPIDDAEEIFALPPSCTGDGVICSPDPSAPNGVVTLQVYNFHDANNFTLANVNVADDLGDTLFVCDALVADQYTYFQWISWWEISVNTSFGQYEMCNFGICIGGNSHLVGREGAQGMGIHGGQCTSGPGSANSIVGTWYSLPEDGLCAEGAPVGTDGCTWQLIGRLKTINSSCLLSDGFVQACTTALAKQNLTVANQLFLAAFESDDTSVGGCPPLPGPEFTSRAALEAFNLVRSSASEETSASTIPEHSNLAFKFASSLLNSISAFVEDDV